MLHFYVLDFFKIRKLLLNNNYYLQNDIKIAVRMLVKFDEIETFQFLTNFTKNAPVSLIIKVQ